MYRLMIENQKNMYFPIIEDTIKLEREMKGTPSKLTFTVIKDNVINFQEGNAVLFYKNEFPVFYGFAFSKKRGKDGNISVTAYDQLRYFKNKDIVVYNHQTASEMLVKLCNMYGFSIGEIENTQVKIDELKNNKTLFDIIYEGLDEEHSLTGKIHVLYDDFGKICLKDIGNLELDTLINSETGSDFDYTSSIDDKTYNQVKLVYKNKDTNKQEVYPVEDNMSIEKWGVLQYYEEVSGTTFIKDKASKLLKLYNRKTRTLSIKGAFGDERVRGGSIIHINLNLGDMSAKTKMIVDKVTHTFKDNEHFMDLTLFGGGFD